jgi:hypothetical protein
MRQSSGDTITGPSCAYTPTSTHSSSTITNAPSCAYSQGYGDQLGCYCGWQ